MHKLWLRGSLTALLAGTLLAAQPPEPPEPPESPERPETAESPAPPADIAEDVTAAAEAPAAPVHVIQRGDLVLSVERDGRIEAVDRRKVRLVPDAYSGVLEFTEVARRGGWVEEGEILFRFDVSRLEENIRSARESLDDQRLRLALAQEELPVLTESNERRLEQAEKALNDAVTAMEVWTSYQGPRMLAAADLSLRGSENSVDNQREELAQLESMYEGVELASETKEIVLERARRGLQQAEGWLGLTRNDHIVTHQFNYPRQQRDTEDNVRYRSQELDHLRVSTRIAEMRKTVDILGLERAIRDGEDRLAKLEADVDRLAVRAPASGLMTAVEFTPGDTANARQVLTEIHDPGAKALKFTATAADLRVLREGDSVPIILPDYPELRLTGRIREIAPIGQPSGDATNFPVIITIENSDPLVRLGLRGKVSATRTLENVVLVPRKAVKIERGAASVKVRDAATGETVQRPIVIAASNDESYQVVEGLDAGDLIEMPE